MPLIDTFGRTISYLRVSVTDRCDFRCTYCMAEDMTFLPKSDVLSLEELERACTAFIRKGVKKIRLTGGEPLVRRNIMSLFQGLAEYLKSGDLQELTLTTNGSQLDRFADELVALGVKRINISLDTLNPETFTALTRFGKIEQTMRGIEAALKAGLKVKINTVALRGVNEHEFDDLLRFCGEHGTDMTLIETMPLGDIGGERVDRYLPLSEVRARMEEKWTLIDDRDFTTGGPSRYVRIAETGQRLGFITPLTSHFCEGCNRVRLTCTGTLYTCLGQDDHVDLRSPLRESLDDGPLMAAIDQAIGNKPKGHEFVIEEGSDRPALARHMNVTGG